MCNASPLSGLTAVSTLIWSRHTLVHEDMYVRTYVHSSIWQLNSNCTPNKMVLSSHAHPLQQPHPPTSAAHPSILAAPPANLSSPTHPPQHVHPPTSANPPTHLRCGGHVLHFPSSLESEHGQVVHERVADLNNSPNRVANMYISNKVGHKHTQIRTCSHTHMYVHTHKTHAYTHTHTSAVTR